MFFGAYILSNVILGYAQSYKILQVPRQIIILVPLLLLVLLILNSLMAASWVKAEQFYLTQIPIVASIFIVTYRFNFLYALLISVTVYFLMSLDNLIANQLKNQLVKFNPKMILKFSAKGIILSYSIMAALIVMLNPARIPTYGLGRTAGEFFDKYITSQINLRLESQMESLISQQKNNLSNILNSDQLDLLEQQEMITDENIISVPKLSFSDEIEKEINQNVIAPYKHFVNPIVAIIAFGLIQFLGFIAYTIYKIIIDPIFWVAKKTGVIITEKQVIEQEVIYF